MGDHKTSGLGKLSELYELPMSKKSSWGRSAEQVIVDDPMDDRDAWGAKDAADAFGYSFTYEHNDAKEFWDELDGR